MFSFLNYPLRAIALSLLVGIAIPLSEQASAQTLEEGIDDPVNATFTTSARHNDTGAPYPEGEWLFDTSVTHDGVDSVRSDLPDFHQSRLDATIQGPAVLSFWWKVNLRDHFDSLRFHWDGNIIDRNTVTDWEQHFIELDCGEHDVSWIFNRDGTIESPHLDADAWLDQVEVEPIPNNPDLQNAVESEDPEDPEIYSLDWMSGAWTGALNETVAKSGPIEPGDSSSLMLEVEGPAIIEFDWRLNIEPTANSRMDFAVNGEVKDTVTVNLPLEEQYYEVGPGTHCLKFTYHQGPLVNPGYMGPNEAYLDNLRITEFDASPELADAVDRAGEVYSIHWERQTAVTRDGFDAAALSSSEVGEKTMWITLPDEPGLLIFWMKADIDDLANELQAIVDNTSLEVFKGDTGWYRVEANLDQGEDRALEIILRQRIVSPSNPDVKGYVDQVVFLPGETNYRPDLSISAPKSRTKGANIHNASGAGQVAVAKVKSRKPLGVYSLNVQSDCPTNSDIVYLRGTKTNKHFKTFFVVRVGGTRYNYTSTFVTGRFRTVALAPGQSEDFEVWIRKKRKSTRKARTVIIKGTSQVDPRKIDVVKAKLKVKD